MGPAGSRSEPGRYQEHAVPDRWKMNRIAMILVLLLGVLSPVRAQQTTRSETELLEDFNHFVFIDKYDLAEATAVELLDRGITPRQFVGLVEDSNEIDRFEKAVAKAMRSGDAEGAAARLQRLWDRGKLEMVRDPAQIANHILLLTGTARQRLYAIERLRAAGEYALPQLLDGLLDRNNKPLQAEVERLLVSMGRDAVIPLCTALPELDPGGQVTVINVLALIPYRTSTPFIAEVRRNTKSDDVRASAERALNRLLGTAEVSPASLFLQLAEGYYAEKSELTSFPGESHQLLWSYEPGVGLFMTAIITPVYHEAMSMRMAERALGLDSSNADALALWIAANFSREIDTPEDLPPDWENPAYPKSRRGARYYAVAAGAVPCQRVLGRALDDNDTPLARRAIAAIQATAGADSLWANLDGRQPLLEALRYPNRRVRYEAALALGSAQPRVYFEGAERVVPILASAVRDASARFALVVSSDVERGQSLTGLLKQEHYTVLPAVRTLDDAAASIAETPGVDLIVTSLGVDATRALISDAHSSPRLAATPVLALIESGPDAIAMANEYRRDAGVEIRRVQIRESMLRGAISSLIETASGGPITEAEARDYADRSLGVLRDLAVSNNAILNVDDAASPLIGVLERSIGSLRIQIADVLARIDRRGAQVALMSSALRAQHEDRVHLLATVALSAKRFGNMLDQRQIEDLISLASGGEESEATAAAALIGALGLSNADLIRVIVNGA